MKNKFLIFFNTEVCEMKNMVVKINRLSDNQIRNLSKVYALELSAKSLKKISNKQMERVRLLNPELHRQIVIQLGFAKTDPLYDQVMVSGAY
jgi:hypothetical protein